MPPQYLMSCMHASPGVPQGLSMLEMDGILTVVHAPPRYIVYASPGVCTQEMVYLMLCMHASLGVGDGDVRNRYCLIGFGSFKPFTTAHFRDVGGKVCYSAADFPRAQAQLLTQGRMEDGYEAIQFALDNVPFRNSPFIAKNILLITDEGRTVIPEGENITRQSIEQAIKVANCCILL